MSETRMAYFEKEDVLHLPQGGLTLFVDDLLDLDPPRLDRVLEEPSIASF